MSGNDKNYTKTVELERSALAIREYFVTEDVAWFADREKWAGLQTVGMVKKPQGRKTGMQARKYGTISVA
ncbi:hypothetical protein LQZ18_13630 [Lachnospiraceae bacterium ZAX-1]